MKANIHPKYHQVTATCTCGGTFLVGSTQSDIKLDICSNCHPFFTGEMKFIDRLGRVDKFMAKRAAASSYKKDKKKQKDTPNRPSLSLKDMLTVTKVDNADSSK